MKIIPANFETSTNGSKQKVLKRLKLGDCQFGQSINEKESSVCRLMLQITGKQCVFILKYGFGVAFKTNFMITANLKKRYRFLKLRVGKILKQWLPIGFNDRKVIYG